VELWTALLGGTLVYRSLRQLYWRRLHKRPCAGRCSCLAGASARTRNVPRTALQGQSRVLNNAAVLTPTSLASCGFSSAGQATEEETPSPLQQQAVEEEVPASAQPPVPEGSLLGGLAQSALRAQRRAADGSLQDVDMPAFLIAVTKYREVVAVMGSGARMALSDCEKNFAGVQACVEAEPSVRKTLRSFLRAELDSGVHHPGQASECKLRDPSGACQLEWLLRGLEFFLTMVKLLFEEDADAPWTAYDQTLQQYHGWITSRAFRSLLMTMPGKEYISTIQDLCPGVTDPKRLATVISRDAALATNAMLPMVQWMIGAFRELGLWEGSVV